MQISDMEFEADVTGAFDETQTVGRIYTQLVKIVTDLVDKLAN